MVMESNEVARSSSRKRSSDSDGAEAALNEASFRDQLVSVIPHLRAFARSLCKDPTQADDLAQEALAKAWKARDSFEPGTSLKAWTFMILRNQFYSEKRRSWRSHPARRGSRREYPAGQRQSDGPDGAAGTARCAQPSCPTTRRKPSFLSARAAWLTRKPLRSASVQSARSRAGSAARGVRSKSSERDEHTRPSSTKSARQGVRRYTWASRCFGRGRGKGTG